MSSDFVPATIGGESKNAQSAPPVSRKPRPSDLKRKAEREAASAAKEIAARSNKARAAKPKRGGKKRKYTKRRGGSGILRALAAQEKSLKKQFLRKRRALRALLKRAKKLGAA